MEGSDHQSHQDRHVWKDVITRTDMYGRTSSGQTCMEGCDHQSHQDRHVWKDVITKVHQDRHVWKEVITKVTRTDMYGRT